MTRAAAQAALSDDTPVMITGSDQLAESLQPMAVLFPEVHTEIAAALGRAMGTDGVIEFTLSELAKNAGVRLGLVKDYMREARQHNVLELLGRRTDNGRIRYCAYKTATNTAESR